jgi:hypothetical protein
MIYVQFFNRRGLDYAEACGDRSVIILDGRSRHATHLQVGAAECRKRGYDAFQVYRGASLLRSSPCGPRIAL